MAGQNVYDDPEFFAAYQRMREADAGITAGVEEAALRALLPDVTGTRVVDLGCGDGRLCQYLAELGAANVLGVDPSARMLALARREPATAGCTTSRHSLKTSSGTVAKLLFRE